MSLQTALRQSGDYKGRTVAYGIASTAQKHNVDIEGMGSVGLIVGATIGQWTQDSGVDPSKFTGPILSPVTVGRVPRPRIENRVPRYARQRAGYRVPLYRLAWAGYRRTEPSYRVDCA